MVSTIKSIARRGTTTLYRLYGQDGALLYIGITENLTRRLYGHARFKHWWGDVEAVTSETFPTWAEAHAVEIPAIKAERPRHNFQHTEAAQAPRADLKRISEMLADTFASLSPTQVDAADAPLTLF